MKYTRIIGTGSFFPEKILTNQDLMKMVDTSDEWIVARTGIHTRHITGKEEDTSEMAHKAVLNAVEMAGINLSEIDGIIFPTISPDYVMPCAAVTLQKRLGLSGPFAFDLNCACSGFIYALGVADGMIRSGMYKTILIAAAERLSTMINWKDRNSCILFGDGAGAVIVRADDKPGVRTVNLHADGSYGDLLYMHGMGSHYLANRDTMDLENEMIVMKGSEIFKLAVRAMCDAAEQAVKDSGLRPEDIQIVVPHQANIRIIEAVAKRLDVSMDNVLVNIGKRGNTSSATIPTALDEGIRSGKVKRGDNMVFAAFGGGLNWGASVVTY